MNDLASLSSIIGALFGNKADQATVGRTVNQILLILLGGALVIIGVVLVVSGSKTAQAAVGVASTVASKGANLVKGE